MRYFATILITLMLTIPAMSDELFRYRGAAKDGEWRSGCSHHFDPYRSLP
jgi:hypothetical protein